jgi:UDP-N-acetylmuramoylalanine--D-glutamate ligase
MPVVDKNLGQHYRSSVALALAVAKQFGVLGSQARVILEHFHGLPSRQQVIARVCGVTYINDTTSTIPDATIVALQRFSKILQRGKKLILIAGGQDKKLEFSEYIHTIKKYADVVILLPGTATYVIKQKLKQQKSRVLTFTVGSMKEAVQKSWKLASAGDIVLLSPGATSFGLFLNEFDRGDKFVAEVKNLTKHC